MEVTAAVAAVVVFGAAVVVVMVSVAVMVPAVFWWQYGSVSDCSYQFVLILVNHCQ